MRRFKRLCILAFVLIATGCVVPAKHPALRQAPLPDIVPHKEFLSSPGATGDYTVSPDGQKIAWLGFERGHWSLFTRDIDKPASTLIDSGCWCNVDWFAWARDSRHILYTISVHGEGGSHIYLADSQLPLEAAIDLTPKAKSSAIFKQHLLNKPGHVLVTQNTRCRQCFDLYKVDLTTGKSTELDRSARNVWQWFSSQNGDVRGRIRVEDDDTLTLAIHQEGEPQWRTLLTWGPEVDVDVLGFTSDEKGLWLLSNRGRDRIALVKLDIASGAEHLVFEDSEVDLSSVFLGPQSRVPKAVISFPDYPASYALDPRVQKGLDLFRIKTHQGIEILSMDDQEKIWTVRVFDDHGAYFFLFYEERGEIIALGENRFDSQNRWSSSVRPISFESRDGLPIHGYLTRPRGALQAAAPMVLLVHGGPWSRDYWGYNHFVQFLANRGYAVLQVNYRGSEGYGRNFKAAAIGEFARKMHTDLLDAVNWAVEKKIADPDAIAIVGGSYGGYASLVGLTQTPDVFACGIAINGVSDIGAFIDSLPANAAPTQRPGIATWHTYVADPKDSIARQEYRRVSPFYHAEKLNKPVLIVFGERDSRVSPEQSEKMIAKLKRLRKPVSALQFMNEGHGISRFSNSVEMFTAIEEFLARHIGGRSAGSQEGSS